MNEIAAQTMRNIARHFIVVGSLIVAMSFGIMSNNNGHVEREPVKESAAYLIQFCEKPAEGEFPGKALVRDLGAGSRYVYSDKAVGKALDDALGGKDWKNVTPISFCK